MSTTYAGLAPVQVDLDQQRADLLELPRYQSPFTVTAAYESKQEPQQVSFMASRHSAGHEARGILHEEDQVRLPSHDTEQSLTPFYCH